jgi:signal transduction histidine kinase
VRAVEARDELIAIVSHDLRSPLTAISIGSTLLDEAIAGGAAHKQVATIRRASEHMEHLIAELLDVAKLEAGKLEFRTEPCTIDSLLEAVGALFAARAAQAEIALTIEPACAGSVTVDRERIVQVLSNLVGNALKFTPPGGRLSVAAHGAGEAVRIAVTDTGPGIPGADVPHLFERYWQGRRRGRGSLGLGLYICKQIVEAHGGRIGVETQAGKGSTFWVELRGWATGSAPAG